MNKKIRNNKILRICFSPVLWLKRLYYNYKNKRINYFNSLFSNVLTGSVILKVENISGEFEIDIRSHLLQRILLNKEYEPDVVNLIVENLNVRMDAINVGANVGLFACLLGDLINAGQKVLAVEPTPHAYQYLIRNIARNSLVNKIALFNGICSNEDGVNYEMNLVVGKEEYTSLGESIHQKNLKEEIQKIIVKGETLDHLVTQHNIRPGMIVIDVEGAEMKVLKGSSEILQKYHPIIISELDDLLLSKQNTSSSEVIKLLNHIGYKVRSIDGRKIGNHFSGNIIAHYGL